MKPSRVFLTGILLASTAVALSTPERWRFDLEARDGLINKRQDPQPTTGPAAASDPAATTGDPAATSAPAPTSTDAAPTSEPAPTSDPATSTSAPPTTSQAPTSPPPNPSQTGSSSSVGLLFTQTTPSSRPVVTITPSAQADNSDSSVPFVDSKYHQLIIALGSVSGALLIALIVTAVVAFRARADNDLLHDRLSRYEQGFDLPQRGKGSPGSQGGYGRLSLHDPDDMRGSRRSLSETQLMKSTPAGRRVSGAPMGSGTPPGNRRVTFGGSDSMHSNAASGSSDHSPLLAGVSTNKGEAPLFPDTHASTSFPPPPEPHRVNSSDSAVRRLPTAPRASNSSHESYTDPFAGGR
ncbi:hypothetical protein FRC07_003202 [Ceratobasidium sp. 392]|nr:hypothetical protein FRC07_003202 [Ceratobasidium sp. 392]